MIHFFLFILYMTMPVSAEEIIVQVYVDDRNERRLEQPYIQTEGRLTPLRQTEVKDLWLGRVYVTKTDKVTFVVETGGQAQRPVDASFSDLESGECTLKVTANAVVMEKGTRQGEESIATLGMQAKALPGVKPSKGNTQRVLVRLDDSLDKSLTAPTVRIQRPGFAAQALKDDGKGLKDTPNDHVHVAWIEVPAQKKVQLAIADDGYALGALNVELPGGADSVVAVTYGSGELSVEMRYGAVVDSSVAQETPSKTDQIAVDLTVDDRILQRLDQPEIQYGSNRSVPLRDDGLSGDSEAGDGLYLSRFSVSRDEYMDISIWDKGIKKGALSVFLPSSNTATIRLRTTDDEAGLKLLSEPQSQGQIDSPGAASAEGGVDRLAHVLWVAILLFAVAFAARRDAMSARWEREVAPLTARLKAELDDIEEREDS